MSDQTHLDALQALLGEQGLIRTDRDMARYCEGARYDQGQAAFVARPASTQEVSQVMAYCAANDICLIPQSGNTGVVSASTPDDSRLQAVLSTERLTQCFELDLDNRSVRVGAGWRLSSLNERLAEHGLFYPVDLSADPCLGGMVATNTGGSRFLRYGDVRQNTLGLEVVLADEQGTVLNLCQSLRKNNTGVDWQQVFIGTGGAFGVVTECVLNLEPLPQQSATAFLVPSSLSECAALLRQMENRLGPTLTAFEGISKNALARTLEHVPSLRNPFPQGQLPDYVILAEVSRPWAVREREQSLDETLEDVLAELWELPESPLADAYIGKPEEMWAIRHAVSEGVKSSGKLVAFDVSFSRGDLMRFREAMAEQLPQAFPDISICDFGHVGDGGLHFNLVLPFEDPRLNDSGFIPSLREWVIARVVEDFSGSFSAEHGIGRTNQRFYDQYTPAQIKKLSGALKAATSPAALSAIHFH